MNAVVPGHVPDFSMFPYELETIYASAPLGLCVLDSELRYLRLNQVLADSSGLSIEQHLGRTVRDVLPKLADQFEPALLAVFQTGAARLNVEVQGETAAQPGISRDWLAHCFPIKNEAGAVVAINAIIEEVTERKRADARFRLLNQAGEILSSSLDYELTLTRVAELAVPVIADWCVVDIADDDGALHRLEITHADPDKQAAAQTLKARYPLIAPDADHTLIRVLHTGRIWFDPGVTEERFVAQARDAEHLRLLRELGYQSEIVAPLAARGKLLGGLTFVYGSSNRRYSAADVEVIEVLARRAALAIDNARLYRAAQVARQEAEHNAARTARLQAITAALSGALTAVQIADIVMQQGIEAVGAQGGTLALLREDGAASLEVIRSVGADSHLRKEWQRIPMTMAGALTEAVQTAAPVWILSLAEWKTRYSRHPLLAGRRAWAALPLMLHGRAFGVLGLSFARPQTFSAADRAFMLAIAQQCAQAMERLRLSESERELAILHERQRLARELHDAVAQTLSAATMMAESSGRIWEKDPERALGIVAQVARLNHAAQAELRTLLWELRPEAILKTKPGDLLNQLVHIIDGRKGLRAELVCAGEDSPLPEAVHIALYRIAQESLNNVVKHSQATQVRVELLQTSGAFTLCVVDDGRGFDSQQVFAGLGLGTMRERAAAIGAVLTITSQPGHGTTTRLIWRADAESP